MALIPETASGVAFDRGGTLLVVSVRIGMPLQGAGSLGGLVGSGGSSLDKTPVSTTSPDLLYGPCRLDGAGVRFGDGVLARRHCTVKSTRSGLMVEEAADLSVGGIIGSSKWPDSLSSNGKIWVPGLHLNSIPPAPGSTKSYPKVSITALFDTKDLRPSNGGRRLPGITGAVYEHFVCSGLP